MTTIKTFYVSVAVNKHSMSCTSKCRNSHLPQAKQDFCTSPVTCTTFYTAFLCCELKNHLQHSWEIVFRNATDDMLSMAAVSNRKQRNANNCCTILLAFRGTVNGICKLRLLPTEPLCSLKGMPIPGQKRILHKLQINSQNKRKY